MLFDFEQWYMLWNIQQSDGQQIQSMSKNKNKNKNKNKKQANKQTNKQTKQKKKWKKQTKQNIEKKRRKTMYELKSFNTQYTTYVDVHPGPGKGLVCILRGKADHRKPEKSLKIPKG